MRGYFDDDGSISLSKRKNSKIISLRTDIAGASKSFMFDLSNHLNDLGLHHTTNTNKTVLNKVIKSNIKPIYTVIFSGRHALKFCKFIYNDTILCLERKRNIYEEYLKIREWESKNLKIKKIK